MSRSRRPDKNLLVLKKVSDTRIFDKLLELLSLSGSGVLLPGAGASAIGPLHPGAPVPAGSGDCGFVGFSAEEWKSLLWEAHRQRVMGLLADAVASLPENQQPPLLIRAQLALELEVIEKKNFAVNSTAEELLSLFSSERMPNPCVAGGLHPVIQKGPSVSALYPNSLHRETGDIDLFFPADEFALSRGLIERLAYGPSVPAPPVTESDGAFWYKYKGVTVEHHPVFYDSHYQFPEIDVKSPEATLIMLSTHILKHALGKGIGLKQICDYFVARRSLDYDSALVDILMKKAGLSRWQRLLDNFGPSLRRIVATEGNFGSASGSVPPTSPKTSSGTSLSSHSSRVSSRFQTAVAFCRKIPFALRYAPREWIHTVSTLLAGGH